MEKLLKHFTTEEIEKELEERKECKKLRSAMPKPLEKPNLTGLRDLLQEYMEFVASDEYHEDNDYRHYIYEKVIETFYGRRFWDWLNRVTA